MASDNDLQEVSLVRKPWFAKRTSWVVIAAIVLVVVVGYVAFRMITHTDTKAAVYKRAVSGADDAFSAGDYDSAINKLQTATSSASSKQDKIDLYSKLAAAAGSNGDVQKAIDYLNKKHVLAPNTASADSEELAGYYERLGNTAKAIELYKQAIAYLDSQPNTNPARRDSKSLQAHVQELEAQ